MRSSIIAFLVLLAGLTHVPSHAQSETNEAQPSPPPNIVIIMVDDGALMDLGVYGGEARTPNIDALAGRGAMFTQFRGSPLCSPSRAMLLTGMDSHATGVSTIPEVLPKEHKGQKGYSIYKGNYKISRSMPPAGDGQWQLYDMINDPGETQDLSDNSPEILGDMITAYSNYARENGVLDMPEGYDSRQQVVSNAVNRFAQKNPHVLIIAGLLLLSLLYGVWRIFRVIWRLVRGV